MALVSSIIIAVIGLLIGGFGIWAGVKLVLDSSAGFGYAVLTALIGAVAWAVFSFFFGWIPIVGPLLMLVIWVGVINWRYPGGWGTAAGIGLVAWIATYVVLYLLAVVFNLYTRQAIGIPGV